MTNKTICFIVQNYYEIDPRVQRKANCVLAAGYSVDVIALQGSSQTGKAYEVNGVRVYPLKVNKRRGSAFQYILEYLVFFILAFIKVTVLMFKRHYQIIDINTLPDFLVFSAMIPKILGAKIVLDMHEVMPEFYMSKFNVAEDHWMIRMIKWQEFLSMRFSDHVMTINEPIKNLLIKRGLSEAKTTVLMNSVDENLLRHKENSRVDGRYVMMYHGTLTPIYGLDIALRGFARVHSHMPGAEFWIVGDGPELPLLKSIVNENHLEEKVKFIGVVPQQQIVNWLVQSDVGVLATRQDKFLDLSFSNKLPEYIVMKKPVMMSRIKTIRYYFSEDALAFFEPENEADLARRMVELYSDTDLRENLAKKAAEEYSAISWDVMRDRYLQLLDAFN